MKFLILLFMAASIPAQTISAQESARKISFRTLVLTDMGTNELLISGAKPDEPTKVSIYLGDISPVVEGSFQNDKVSFLAQGAAGKDGAVVFIPVATGPLAKSSRQLFIIYANPAAKPETPFLITALDDDLKNYPMGMVRAFNLSPVAVRFKLAGDTSPELAAGKVAYFRHAKKVDDFNMYPAEVAFKSATGNWVSASSSAWKSTDRTRLLVVTSIDPRSKNPVVRLFNDAPSWINESAVPQ